MALDVEKAVIEFYEFKGRVDGLKETIGRHRTEIDKISSSQEERLNQFSNSLKNSLDRCYSVIDGLGKELRGKIESLEKEVDTGIDKKLAGVEHDVTTQLSDLKNYFREQLQHLESRLNSLSTGLEVRVTSTADKLATLDTSIQSDRRIISLLDKLIKQALPIVVTIGGVLADRYVDGRFGPVVEDTRELKEAVKQLKEGQLKLEKRDVEIEKRIGDVATGGSGGGIVLGPARDSGRH